MTKAEITCRAAATPEEIATHYRIRHQVFVTEQGLFAESDRDEHDADPAVWHTIGYVDGEPAGTVRFYRIPPVNPGEVLWKGDRLTVLPEFRRHGLGAPLVRFAVATGGQVGGDRMIATIQEANTIFFERLGWTRDGGVYNYVGAPHQNVWIELSR